MDDWHLDVVEMDLGNQEEDLVAELAEAYPDAELRTLIQRATDGRVDRQLLTGNGLYAARYLAAVVMSKARESLADNSPLGSPQGAMQVILQGISDRFGARPGQRFNSYEVIGRRLAVELYNGIVDALRLYRPRPVTEEQLAAGKGGDDALRAVREAGGYLVLAPELQDGPDAIAALLAFLGDESGKSRRRVDVLAAVVRVMRSFVSHGWHDSKGGQNVPISAWRQLDEAVAADIRKRSKAAC